MTQDDKMEEYLKKALSGSIYSTINSKDEKMIEKSFSRSYFEDLKEKLLIQYKDKSLKEVMNCRECETSFGDALKITTTERINFNIEDNDFMNQINNNLKLLPKIGLKTEESLKDKGFTTIGDSKMKSNDEKNKFSMSDLIHKASDVGKKLLRVFKLEQRRLLRKIKRII